MKRRTLAIVLAAGALAAVAGRALVRPLAPPSFIPPPAPRPSPPLPETRATVAVYDDGNPEADRAVVFHAPDGTVLAWRKTGKDGTASGPVVRGSMITVAHGTSIKHLVTVAGVEPDDRVVVGEEEDEGGPGRTACTAIVSSSGPLPAAARYTVALGVNETDLSDPAKPQRASVLERFLVDGKFRVLAEATGDAGAPVAFAHGLFSGCGGDAGARTVDAPLPAWSTDYRSFVIAVTGTEAAGSVVTGELSLSPPGADAFGRGRREAVLRGRAELRFRAPRPLGARGEVRLKVSYPGSADHATLEEGREAIPENFEIDLDARLLPRVSDPVVDRADPKRPIVRFRVRGGGAKADAVVVRLGWPSTREHLWTFVAPPDVAPSIAFPALPDELEAWRPGAASITPAVGLVEASFLEGFADVKKKGLGALEDPPEGAERRVVRTSLSGDLHF